MKVWVCYADLEHCCGELEKDCEWIGVYATQAAATNAAADWLNKPNPFGQRRASWERERIAIFEEEVKD